MRKWYLSHYGSSGVVNNKGADQPVHPRRLMRGFVICFLESIRHI